MRLGGTFLHLLLGTFGIGNPLSMQYFSIIFVSLSHSFGPRPFSSIAWLGCSKRIGQAFIDSYARLNL